MNSNSFADEHGTWIASGSSKYIRYKKHLEIKDARRAPRPIYKSAGIGNAALAVWGACIYGPPDVPYMKLMRFQSSLIQGVEIMERATL